jgi:hypothetical protein
MTDAQLFLQPNSFLTESTVCVNHGNMGVTSPAAPLTRVWLIQSQGYHIYVGNLKINQYISVFIGTGLVWVNIFEGLRRGKVIKVKVTLVQALRLCTGRTAHRRSRGIALLFHDHGTRKGWGVSVTPRPLFTPGKDPVPIVQEAGWAQGPVWTGAKNLTPTGILSPDRPARSQSLYRLR